MFSRSRPASGEIEAEELTDIQEGIVWYNKRRTGPGWKFHVEVKKAFEKPGSNPYFQLRYDDVRCLPIKKLTIHDSLYSRWKAWIYRNSSSVPYDPRSEEMEIKKGLISGIYHFRIKLEVINTCS